MPEDSAAESGQGAYRSCGCGFEDRTDRDVCPDCGADWFVTPNGEVNGFAE